MHVVIVGWDGAGTDLPGAERFRGLAPMYWRGAHAVVVGFDVTRMKGMASCDDWVAQLHALGFQTAAMALRDDSWSSRWATRATSWTRARSARRRRVHTLRR